MKNSGEEGSRSSASRVVGGRGKWTVVGGGRRSSSVASIAVGRGGGDVEVLSGMGLVNATFLVGAEDLSFRGGCEGKEEFRFSDSVCEEMLSPIGSSLNDP